MQPMLFQRWQASLERSWCRLVYAVTDRVPWPLSKYLADPRRRFIYCPIAKVACTSLKLWMLSVAGDTPPRPFNEQVEVQRYSLRNLGHRAALQVLKDPDYFSFAFVRNPWSRVVSAYLNKFQSVNITSQPVLARLRRGRGRGKVQADATFREFIEFLSRGNPEKFDEHWRPQHLFLKDVHLDFLGRFEHLLRDFAWVQQRLAIDTPLPHNNVTCYAERPEPSDSVAECTAAELGQRGAFPDYRRFYTPRLRDLVGRIYAEDIERFGYDFDS
jgi:hypothetical protein